MGLRIGKALNAVRLDRNAIRITALYWLIGGLWILLSDRFAAAISNDIATFTMISLYKGWFYVLATGLILYGLIHRNNSLLRRDNEEVQAAEKSLRDLFENATIGIYRSTPDGRLLMVNPELASMFGYASPEEFLASVNDVAGQIYKDSARRQDFLKTLNEQGFIKEFINEERRKDGSVIWTSTTARAVKDGAGNILYYEGFNIDINERKRSEESIKKILDTAIDGFYLVDMEGKILEANDSYCSMIGYRREELLKMSIKDIEAVETEEIIRKRIQRIFENGSDHFETKHKRKDGSIIAVEASANYLKGEQDEQGRLFVFMRDITEREQIEEKLRESEEKYRLLVEQVPVVVYEAEVGGRSLYISPQVENLIGFSVGEWLADGSLWLNRIHPDDKQRVLEENVRAVSENRAYALEYRIIGREGKTIWIRDEGQPVRANSGTSSGIRGIWQNITERKQAEEALQKAEEKYHTIFSESIEGIFQSTPEGNFITVNPALARMWGYESPEDLIASIQNIADQVYVNSSRRDEFRKLMREEGEVYGFEYEVKCKDGQTMWVSENARAVRDAAGKLLYYEGHIEDITERKRAEESVRKASMYNRSLIEASLDPLVTIGPNGKITDVNASTENATGFKREALIGTDFSNYFTEPEKARSGYQEVFQKGAVRNYPLELKHRDGSLTPISYNASVYYDTEGDLIGVFAAARDITERKKAEEALRMRLTELELIYQSGLELSQILEPEQIAQKIIGQLEKQLDWHHTAIRLYDAESEIIKIIGFNVPGIIDTMQRQGIEGHFNSLVQKPGDGLTGWVVQHDQTLRIGDLKQDPRYTETFPGLNSGLYVPLTTEGRVIGVISVENELPNAFSESDERLVRTLASQAAIAFENSRLHKETVRQLHQLQALHSIDLAITNSLDLNIIIEVLVNQAIQQLGLDAAAIFVLQSDLNSLKYLSSKGFRAHLLETASQDLLLNESFAGRAIYGRRAIELPASQEPREELKEIWMTEGFHTLYAIPLLTKGEAKGVIEVFYRSENKRPTKIQKDFLETLASQAAIAIENIHLFEGLHRSNMELAIAYDATIEGWSRAMDLRDEETEGHTKRVVDMTLELAAGFGFSGDMLTQIRRGALLHDIGKLGVPDSILFKPDKLSDEEWAVMKRHPTFAFEMLAPIQYLNRAINIPYCHHEKWDGTGYPRGLNGEQIPLEARIFAVVDVWDALTSDRPYRKAWSKQKTIKYIQSLAGTHFDPAVVERFMELQKREEQQKR